MTSAARRLVGDFAAHPLFWAGLAIRLALVVFLTPKIQSDWFVPFMREAVLHPSIDPWTSFLAGGGAAEAFPYGPVMLFSMLPLSALGVGLDQMTGGGGFVDLGFRLTLLAFDLGLLLLLARLWPEARRMVLWLYWTSPIVLFITYWHGQIDIVPTALLAAALVMVKERRVLAAAALLGLSVSAKLSMFIAVPFIVLFFLNNHHYRPQMMRAGAWFAGTFILFQGLHLFSGGVEEMMLASREFTKIYDIRISLSDELRIYVVPLAYFFSLYMVFLIPRMNFQFLMSVLGVGFLIFLLLTPASAGWFLWFVPFLIDYQLRHPDRRRALAIGAIFSLLLVAYKAPISTGAASALLGFDGTPALFTQPHAPWQDHLLSLILSLFVGFGFLLALSALRRGIEGNDFYHLARRPVGIGITGDSGAGKDTLAGALKGMFGTDNVAELCGDDYHRYERGAPMWDVVTHLDPQANDLHAFTRDGLALLQRKTVSHQRYDHATGRFTRPEALKSNHIVIVSGLHVFFSRQLSDALDVRVFLAPDERLRRRFKMARDMRERGKSREEVEESMDSRWSDSLRYIQPQADLADIAFSVQPPGDIAVPMAETSATVLRVVWRDAPHFWEFVRVMIGVCGIGVDVISVNEQATVDMLVHSHGLTPEDTCAAASCLVPHLEELLAGEPVWSGGDLGVMQLLVLLEIVSKVGARRQMRGR